jgi:hypothetical protein
LKVVRFKINKLFTFIAMGFWGISEIVPVDTARVIGGIIGGFVTYWRRKGATA